MGTQLWGCPAPVCVGGTEWGLKAAVGEARLGALLLLLPPGTAPGTPRTCTSSNGEKVTEILPSHITVLMDTYVELVQELSAA